MAPKAPPGPTGRTGASGAVDDGTLARTLGARPGSIGRANFDEVYFDTFGPEMFDEFLLMIDRVAQARSDSKKNQKLFWGIAPTGSLMQLDADMDVLESLARSYDAALDGGGAIDVAYALDLHDMLTVSLEIVEYDNDVLASVFVMQGLTSFFSNFKALEPRAKKLEADLAELKKLLERAQQEHTEAKVKTALNVLITGVMVMMGPLALLTRGSIFVGQQLLNDALGASPGGAVEKGSQGIDAAGEIGAALNQYNDISWGTKSVAAGVAKGATAAGVIFDLNEVKTAGGRVEALEKKVYETNASHRAVLAVIERVKPGLQLFIVQKAQWSKRHKRRRREVEDLRMDLLYMRKGRGFP